MDLILHFALVYLHILFVSNFFERNYIFPIERLISLQRFYIPVLPLTLFFIYRRQYSFSSDKNGYSVKDSFTF